MTPEELKEYKKAKETVAKYEEEYETCGCCGTVVRLGTCTPSFNAVEIPGIYTPFVKFDPYPNRFS